MPLVRIDAPTYGEDVVAAIGNLVHEALVETMNVPPDDRFQVQSGAGRLVYDPTYLGVQRDGGFLVVQVFLRAGRSHDMKRAFYKAVAARAERVGVEARNIMIVLTENDLADWSFGDGVAQMIEPGWPPSGGQPANGR